MFCYQARKRDWSAGVRSGGTRSSGIHRGNRREVRRGKTAHLPGLGFLGIELDPARNDAHASTISTPESRCIVRAIPTDEDLMVARYTHSVAFARG